MTVITVSRQRGSMGSYIALEVADRLGLQYLDREIIDVHTVDYLPPSVFVKMEAVVQGSPGDGTGQVHKNRFPVCPGTDNGVDVYDCGRFLP